MMAEIRVICPECKDEYTVPADERRENGDRTAKDRVVMVACDGCVAKQVDNERDLAEL